MLRLSGEERQALALSPGVLPFAVTPYYASLLDPEDDRQPLRRTSFRSWENTAGSRGNRMTRWVRNGTARFPALSIVIRPGSLSGHRILLNLLPLLHAVQSGGKPRSGAPRASPLGTGAGLHRGQFGRAGRAALGGGSLTLPNDRLEWLLSRLRRIPHVEFLRIGTKVPVFCPARHPRPHAHPKALSPIVDERSLHASGRIDPGDDGSMQPPCRCRNSPGEPNGSPGRCQRRRGDHAEIVRGLLKIRVKPYYLYQCDSASRDLPFPDSRGKGARIIKGLRATRPDTRCPPSSSMPRRVAARFPSFPTIWRDGTATNSSSGTMRGRCIDIPIPGENWGMMTALPLWGDMLLFSVEPLMRPV